MYEARSVILKKKPRIILNKDFPIFNDIQVGEKGQCIIYGSIISDRKDAADDGTEYLVKTVEIDKVEAIEERVNRSNSGSI
ncbi:hypothetical protein M0R04_11880 [Candidatus Dojkabacteria bacterium]|jgi:hypothetical protein|nr:hypothetical protein [Candidatus Dojkabacteria bacterium]